MDKAVKTKVFTLVGLLCTILIFSVYMYSQIPVIEDIKLEISSFKNEIKYDTDSLILKNINMYATSAYHQLVDEIITESKLKKIDDTVAEGCFACVESAFAENVLLVSSKSFKKRNWTKGAIAELLRNNKLAYELKYPTKSQKEQFAKNKQIAENFFHACGIVNSCNIYVGIDKAKKMIENSRLFIEDSNLAPCDSLLSELSLVSRNLYKAHLNYVNKTCNEDICNDFVANAKMYGVSENDAEKDIKKVRDFIEQERIRVIIGELDVINKVDDNNF